MDRIINLAYYDKSDWQKFLGMIDDREVMHDHWEDWYSQYQKTRLTLISSGLVVQEVRINLDELRRYCLERGIKIDGKARSQFASEHKPDPLHSFTLK